MATLAVNPNFAFNLSNVNLNWYAVNGYASNTLKNSNNNAAGTIYPDHVYIAGSGLGSNLELDFFGANITGTPLTGITGGTVQFVGEVNLTFSSVLWYVKDISVSAKALYDAGLTPSNADELSIIAHALSGPDNITLSNLADYISGFDGNDTIAGMGGNDTIDGGAGIDTAVFSSTRASATIVRNGDGTYTVSSVADGTDLLINVERVQFADRSLFLSRFTNAGSAVVANFNPANGWTSQDQAPRHVADVNGDGYADIVGFGTAGVLVSFGSANGSFGPVSLAVGNFGQTAGWTSDNAFHRVLGDVNGDGRADIIGFGQAGTLVSLAQANGTFAAPVLGIANFGAAQGWTSDNAFHRVVGDVNGDGKADIVGFGQAGTLVALGNGDGTFKPVQTGLANFGTAQGWTSDNTFHRELADVNGDGKADIIGFGQAGVLVALSNGDGTFQAVQSGLANFGTAQGWPSQDSFARLVADVNGDHIGDIVGFGQAGTLVAYGRGDGSFLAAVNDTSDFGAAQGWTSDATFHREVADLNHDGLADIVGFGFAGVLAGMNQGDILV